MHSADKPDVGAVAVLDLPVCRHRGKIHENGLARCRSYKTSKSPLGLVVVQDSCPGCKVADLPHGEGQHDRSAAPPVPPQIVTDYKPLPCDYRVDTGKTQVADLCGLRGVVFPVYQCKHPAILADCVGFRICHRQTLRACATCEERETFRKDRQ